MKNHDETISETAIELKVVKNENGLQRLVMHYQDLFETDENLKYYSAHDYQNAKRKFVKYLLDSRGMMA